MTMMMESHGSKRRVLVLEDVGTTRRAFMRFLELKGFEAHGAESPEEAEELLRNVTFHVACIDLGMNEEDQSDFRGQDILRQIAGANRSEERRVGKEGR